jgi:hypothetical protein
MLADGAADGVAELAVATEPEDAGVDAAADAELDVLCALSAGLAPPPQPYAAPMAKTENTAHPPTKELFMRSTLSVF